MKYKSPFCETAVVLTDIGSIKQSNIFPNFENIIITGSILLLFILGLRFNLENRLQQQEENIETLVKIVQVKNIEINKLKEQLTPPDFVNPLDVMIITSETGYRKNPMGGTVEKLHRGNDYTAEIGTPWIVAFVT